VTITRHTTPGFEFGPFFVDTTGHRLLRNGVRVEIAPKPLKLLEVLLRNQKRVVTNKELRILVWADDPTQVSEPYLVKNALYVAVGKLKKALKEYSEWIVNIHGVGYMISDEAEVKETAPTIHLPQATTPLIGRESEILQIQNVLKGKRLVTLRGSPGVGKTRLAISAAAELNANFSDGIHLVDLVAVSDENLVPKAVASALGVSEEAGQPLLDTLRDYFKIKEVLLILDNCEHVVETAAALSEDLLHSTTRLKILSTSRQSLDIPAETVVSIEPLAFPSEDETPSVDEIRKYPAAELFLELAKRRDSHFRVSKKNVCALADLCRQLEGIPLAIELAAAQTDSLPVERILSLMSDRFKLLRRNAAQPSRHQTLEVAIDWSYETLTRDEKTLMRRLSVFAGGWTVEAATAVCAGGDIKENDVVFLLSALVKKSLAKPDERDGRIRYRMLEMIRQYSALKLESLKEASEMTDKHAQYFVSLSERAYEEGETGDWMDRLEDDHPNLRAALRHSTRETGNIGRGLRLCGALGRFWYIRGHISEAIYWTNKALALDNGRSKDARARALRTGGFFFGQMADSSKDASRGRDCFNESVAIWRELDNPKELARTLTNFSFLLDRQGDFPNSTKAARESRDIFDRLGDPANTARATHNLALSLMDQGDFEGSIPRFEESLKGAREVGDLQTLCLHNLGEAAMQKGDLESAEQTLKESLTISRALGHKSLSARTMIIEGEIALKRGDSDLALEKQRTALRELKSINDKPGIVDALEAIACTESARGNPSVAMVLYGGASRQRKISNIPLGPVRQRLLNECLNSAKASLGDGKAQQLLTEAYETELELIIWQAMREEV
jgi:predicted ATPase/DNA-binding winged helix-turn-helix (wHTH) protein